jgi:hypothetical protein
MQMIKINSRKINHVLDQHYLLIVVLKTGECFLHRQLEFTTYAKFMYSANKDTFYKSEIEDNKKSKNIQILSN